jgi:hypothetical protein
VSNDADRNRCRLEGTWVIRMARDQLVSIPALRKMPCDN